MSIVSLRLPDDLLKEAENRARALHIPRAEYIRRAIAVMNDEVLAHKRRERLAMHSHSAKSPKDGDISHWLMAVSKRVRAESMKVNAEFDTVA